MSRIQIRKQYLTLGEVAIRWELDAINIRRAVMDGTLPVVIMRNEPLARVEIDGRGVMPVDGEPEHVCDWLRPIMPTQVGPFESLYGVVQREGGETYALPRPLTLSKLLEEAVAFVSDLEAVERERRAGKEPDVREVHTLEKMVLAWAIEIAGYRPWENPNRMKLKRALLALDDLGLGLSHNTVRKHLKDCWQRVKTSEALPEWNEADDDWSDSLKLVDKPYHATGTEGARAVETQ